MMAGWQMTQPKLRFSEMLSGIREANELHRRGLVSGLGVDGLDQFRRRMTDDLQSLAVVYFSTASWHFKQYISLDSSWPDNFTRCDQVQKVFESAASFSPTDTEPFLALVKAITDAIEWCQYNDEYGIFCEQGASLDARIRGRMHC